MNFENQLHEDLFHLFVINYVLGFIGKSFKDEVSAEDFEMEKLRGIHSMMLELFPQENHPEEYEAWLPRDHSLKLGYAGDYVGMPIGNCTVKAKITLGDE